MQNKFSKKLGIIIIALLTISTISAAIPFASATITNRPTVYKDDTTADPLSVEAGTYVNITTSGMTITGAQVWLWLSTYGGSEIDRAAGDRWYAGPFYLGDISASAETVVTFSAATVPAPFDAEGRTYSFVVGYGWINGTVPLLVQGSNVDYWIKVADQSPRDIIVGSEVGVSTNRVRFTTGFGATPLAGAPDTLVTVSGYAIQTGTVYNITQGAQLVAYFVTSTTHNVSGWLWTGFDVPFNIRDLQGRCTNPSPSMTAPVNITVTNHNTTLLAASWNFVQTYREVYLPTGTFRPHASDQTGSLNLLTGGFYNLTTAWFPAGGSVSVYLNTTLVASGITLNGTGGNGYTTLTIPALVTGNYFFRVIDNNNVEYNFTVLVTMVPYITLTPAMGYVGDQFTVTGTNFLDYVGQYITIYFQNTQAGGYTLLWNETIASSGWVTGALTVPQSWGGPRTVSARNVDGTTPIANATFTVLARINVLPDEINNTVCEKVQVEGTGFWYGGTGPEDFFFYIDNSMYFGDDEDWASAINSTGYILTEFAASGFRPGLHEVHVIADYEGAMMWTIYAKDNFWVTYAGDLIKMNLDAYLESINVTVTAIWDGMASLESAMGDVTVTLAELDATIVAVDGNIATLDTKIGTIQTTLTSMNAKLTSIQNDIASIDIPGLGTIETKLDSIDAVIGAMYGDVVTINTTVGTFDTTLAALDAAITAVGNTVDDIDDVTGLIAGDVVEIQTTLGTIEGKIDSIEDNIATIITDLGTVTVDLASVKTDVSTVQDEVDTGLPVDMMPVWIAVVLALIAAIGSIAGVFIIQRKIA